jgi:hypothetical protein
MASQPLLLEESPSAFTLLRKKLIETVSPFGISCYSIVENEAIILHWEAESPNAAGQIAVQLDKATSPYFIIQPDQDLLFSEIKKGSKIFSLTLKPFNKNPITEQSLQTQLKALQTTLEPLFPHDYSNSEIFFEKLEKKFRTIIPSTFLPPNPLASTLTVNRNKDQLEISAYINSALTLCFLTSLSKNLPDQSHQECCHAVADQKDKQWQSIVINLWVIKQFLLDDPECNAFCQRMSKIAIAANNNLTGTALELGLVLSISLADTTDQVLKVDYYYVNKTIPGSPAIPAKPKPKIVEPAGNTDDAAPTTPVKGNAKTIGKMGALNQAKQDKHKTLQQKSEGKSTDSDPSENSDSSCTIV